MKGATGHKTHVLRFRAVNRDIFRAIESGEKKIETRAATPRYQRIQAGDSVRLICGKNTFRKDVKKVRILRTIPAMLKIYRTKQINPSVSSAKELKALYYSFPGYREKIKKYGLVALELK